MRQLPEGFDDKKLMALLGLAGPVDAIELVQRLDEDLTRVAQTLQDAEYGVAKTAIRSQSHVLLAIAGAIGATQVFEMSSRLNLAAQALDGVQVAEVLADIQVPLHELILHVRSTRAAMTLPS